MLAILGLSTLVLMTATLQISAYLTKKAIGENLKPLQSVFSKIAGDAVVGGLILEDTAEIRSALGEQPFQGDTECHSPGSRTSAFMKEGRSSSRLA